MEIRIDRTINNIENTLSDISAYPVVGILAGTAKVILGVAQSITALVCGILALIPCAVSGNWSLMRHSWTHIKHGLGNITGGIFEAIPLIGTAMYFYRQYGASKDSDAQAHLSTGHENKWMPYTSLVEQDWKITGAEDDAVKRAKTVFARKLQDNGGPNRLSSRRQMELAQEVLGNVRPVIQQFMTTKEGTLAYSE